MNQLHNSPFVPEETYQLYLAGLLTNNRQQCRASFEHWMETDTGLRSLYEDLVQRALYEIGDLWERGRISVASLFGMDALVHAATEIRAAFPEVPVLVGGRGFRWGGRGQVERLPGVRYLTSLGELESWIKEGETHV